MVGYHKFARFLRFEAALTSEDVSIGIKENACLLLRPREDVSVKALGSYAPSALQTDILPRSE